MTTFEDQLKDAFSTAYDIERELGGGGMSRVFVATDRLLGRKVVIKVLSPELTAEVNRGRFRREIQVAAQLQHPHIVSLFSAGEHDDLVYYTMPFIEGESLKSALEKHGKLTVPEVIRVIYDVVDALSYAHGHGVIHRDIKPGNILRSGSHALVTDFGVAKALNAAISSQAMTSTGMAIGTPAYMAPEQLAGDPSADHRVDLYAVGLLSYELLSGQSPFAATTAQGVLAAVLTREPKPLFEVRKEVPKKLSAIIMSCLSKVPGGRPPHAEALLDALDMIATSSGEIRTREHKVPQRGRTPTVPAPPVVIPTEPTAETVVQEAAPPPQPVEKKKRSPMMLAAAIVLLVVAAGAGWAITQRGKSTKVASNDATTPNAASMTTPSSYAAPGVAPAAAVVAPPVDSVAIANAIVAKRLADAEAKKTTTAPVNADSLRRALQKQISDSIARANAQRAKDAAAQKTLAAKTPTTTAAPTNNVAAPAPAPPTTAAPAPAPAVAEVPAPPPSGKKRLAITGPRAPMGPVLRTFTGMFIRALHASLDGSDDFDAIPQEEVSDVMARTRSRDEAAKILKPDVVVWPGYTSEGDTVNVIITVWDLRSSSSYGIRVSSTKIAPGNPEHYLGALVQATMKQLNDLANMPTIYRRK